MSERSETRVQGIAGLEVGIGGVLGAAIALLVGVLIDPEASLALIAYVAAGFVIGGFAGRLVRA